MKEQILQFEDFREFYRTKVTKFSSGRAHLYSKN